MYPGIVVRALRDSSLEGASSNDGLWEGSVAECEMDFETRVSSSLGYSVCGGSFRGITGAKGLVSVQVLLKRQRPV